MNYRKVYQQLIAKRLDNPAGGYIEKHHIRPRSEGGSDDADNIVSLTAREHYVAHLLLAKIYDDVKMTSAVIYMQTGSKNRSFKFNSRLYARIREKFAVKMSQLQKGRHSYNNGKIEVCCFECPEGFVPGRLPYSEEALKNMKAGKQSPKAKVTAANNFRKAAAMRKGKPFSEEHNRKISEATRGEKNHMYGKSHSDEAREKMRQSQLGKVYWTDGVKNVKARECPGPGWRRGMSEAACKTRSRKMTSTGFYWWNNGQETVFSRECPGKGWSRGRGKLKK